MEAQQLQVSEYTQRLSGENGTHFMLDAMAHWVGLLDYPPAPPQPPAPPPPPPPSPPQPPRPPPPPPSPLPPPFDFWSAWGVAEQGASIAFGTATALVSGTAGPAVDLLAGGYAAEQFRPSLPPLPPPSTPPLAARGLDISLAVAPPLAGLLGVAAAARWLLARRNKPAAESQRAVLV